MTDCYFTRRLWAMVAYMKRSDLILAIPYLLTAWPTMRRGFWISLRLMTFDLRSRMRGLRTYLLTIQLDWKAWTRRSYLMHDFLTLS